MKRSFFLFSSILVTVLLGACSDSSPMGTPEAPAASPSTQASAAVSAPPQRIVLVGWDAEQRENVMNLLERGDLPTLKRLSAQGTIVPMTVTGVTDTKAGWTQILTGLNPEATGVYMNLCYSAIPEGYTVFDRLEEYFGADNVVTAAAIGMNGNLTNQKPTRELPAAALPQDCASGQPAEMTPQELRAVRGGLFQRTRIDVFAHGLQDEAVCALATGLLEQHKDERLFLFVHFQAIDKAGHEYGRNSAQYDDALRSVDALTGRILDKIDGLGLGANSLVYVTADHGFDEGQKTHSNAPNVFLATNDRSVVHGGSRADVAATILDRFGLDITRLEPPLSGTPLSQPSE